VHALAASSREAFARMGDDSVGVTSLPMTVAARRNARLRAAALATIPLWLFVVAALPRVWAPDLVPFGSWQARYVGEAIRRAPVSWADLYGDLTVPTVALLDPLLRLLPAPIVVWVVLRGLLDAVGVGLLYLAARPLLGIVPAILAALLYAVSPTAWAAARDPAGPLAPVVMAAALLAAVRLVQRPTLLRGAIFGIVLGLLARSVPVGIIAAVAGAATLAIGRASWRVGGLMALGLVVAAGPALFTNLDLVTRGQFFFSDTAWMAGQLVQASSYPLVGLADPLMNPFDHSYDSVLRALSQDMRLRVMLIGGYGSHILEPMFLLLVGGLLIGAVRARRGQTGPLLIAVWAVIWLLSAAWITEGVAYTVPRDEVQYLAVRWNGPIAALPPLLLLLSVPLLARRPLIRWAGLVGVIYLLVIAAADVGWSIHGDALAEWQRAIFAVRPSDFVIVDGPRQAYFGSGPLQRTQSLREATALSDALRDAAERVKTGEVITGLGGMPPSDTGQRAAPVLGQPALRSLGGTAVTVLPLERETVFVRSDGESQLSLASPPIELRRPSSSVGVFTPNGADTGARIVTLRPRALTDWLSGAVTVSDGRFADGTVLLGVRRQPRPDGKTDLALYWQLPLSSSSGPLGDRFRVGLAESPLSQPGSDSFLPQAARRSGEIVEQIVQLEMLPNPGGSSTLQVTLYDELGTVVRTATGAVNLDVPLGSAAR
jgi:hypothetical protein